jgi:hypothetical protein
MTIYLAWIALATVAAGTSGFIGYWYGVGKTERHARHVVAQFRELQADYLWCVERTAELEVTVHEMRTFAGVLTPAEREAFDQITGRQAS